MLSIYDIPNKLVFWLSWIGAIPFLIWMAFGNEYFGILSGICLLAMGLLSIIKPELFPKFKILYNTENTKNTYKISQKIMGIVYILLAVFILCIEKIQTSADIGFIIVLFFGAVLISYIIYEKRHLKIDNTVTTSYVKSSIAGCAVFVILGIILIINNASIAIEPYPLIFGCVIGGGIALLLLKQRTKKFSKEEDLHKKSPERI